MFAGTWAVNGRNRVSHRINTLGGVEKTSGVDLGDFAAGEKGDGDVGGGHGVRKFRDGKDVVGIEGKEDGMKSAGEGVDRRANGIKTVG